MSDSDKTIICPNCGFHAVGNYCSECGQNTHLHKETFWGLVMHFVGDYFHYDSKFWLTIKALWFSPGKLTTAYWNKQRMRYIPPVSLYIFISAVYFILSFNSNFQWMDLHTDDNKVIKKSAVTYQNNSVSATIAHNSKIESFIEKKWAKIKVKYPDVNDFFNEKINHTVPKIFFFMIPVLAILLKLVFLRRKDLFFVDHAIFALHYHSFWFSVFILSQFNLPKSINSVLLPILLLAAAYYFVSALHNVYKISFGKSIVTTIVIGISYSLLLAVVFLASLVIIVAAA